ncbi:acetoacetyl-CoA synthetase [Microbacterium mangrovi]|uniref:Acetoacetyl-CoA synthetase n=1 Tax=Microbacterium mangrovi TaxID=1348253 RepID=A0A0B2A4T8_9MICO|nr:acetoacetate--CoA ligase [Microbacterium mangrovi]KHK96612.1 acetoacetyl-CoA synthetase [Microbacterium mangrovi]
MTDVTWRPDPARATRMGAFIDAAADRGAPFGRGMRDYRTLWEWSVSDVSGFWDAVRVHFDVLGDGFSGPALAVERMPGAVWYPDARVNFAENVLRPARDPQRRDEPAIIDIAEDDASTSLSWRELESWVAVVAARLADAGIRPGDRVAAVLPNVPEAIVGLLAAAAVGAVWSICSPDLAPDAVVARLAQLEPRVLIAFAGYTFNGKWFDRHDQLRTIVEGMPSVEQLIVLESGTDAPVPTRAHETASFPERPRDHVGAVPEYRRIPFDHPLWVLFSSGTTGIPKGIVHGHGGILLEALKGTGLCQDMGPGDTYYVAANTSWMVWNTLVTNLASGATVVTYAGSPTFGHPARQFEIIERAGVTMFGVGAAYLALVEKSGAVPREQWDLCRLRSILSTGSPLPPSTWRWVHDAVKSDVHLGSDSGGTDICSGFVGSNPLSPVHLGESQGPLLGVAVEAWSPDGTRVRGEVGEMVIRRPMPSMPLFLWNDESGTRYRDSYFATFPGVWAQGDWITETARGGFVVHGRSDATLNRHGVRLGTADIYAALQDMPEVADSLVLGIEGPDGAYWMPLFVALAGDTALDADLRDRIASTIRARTSARHVPDEIIACPAIPLTHAGKRIEVPLKKLFTGRALDLRAVRGTLANAEALDWFCDFASRDRPREQA